MNDQTLSNFTLGFQGGTSSSGTGGTTPTGTGYVHITGGTQDAAASAPATVRADIGAAASGANSDITSLTGLTTPIPTAEGGTGATTAAAACLNLGAVRVLCTTSTNGSATNTTAETSLFGTLVGTKTFGANSLTLGKVVRVLISGYVGSTLTPTLTLKFKMGSTAITSSLATTLSAVTIHSFTCHATFTVGSTGAGGTVMAASYMTYLNGTASTGIDMSNVTAASVDTTVSNVLDFTATWSAASPSNTIVGQAATVEVLN